VTSASAARRERRGKGAHAARKERWSRRRDGSRFSSQVPSLKELARSAMLFIAMNADLLEAAKALPLPERSELAEALWEVSPAKAMNRRSLPHRPTNSTGGSRSIGAIPRAGFLGNRSKWNWIKSTDAPSEPAGSFPVEDRLVNATRAISRKSSAAWRVSRQPSSAARFSSPHFSPQT
jgi:hypothetical protein